MIKKWEDPVGKSVLDVSDFFDFGSDRRLRICITQSDGKGVEVTDFVLSDEQLRELIEVLEGALPRCQGLRRFARAADFASPDGDRTVLLTRGADDGL